MLYNRHRLIRAPISQVWPWVLQLGKSRAGWYLPRSWEPFLPSSWPAARTIHSEWQTLKVGDRVPDYGFGEGEWFDVVERFDGNGDREPTMEAEGQREGRERWLVYRSDRMGTSFTWALILTEVPAGAVGSGTATGETVTKLHLRFRGNLGATGIKRKLILWGGDFMDWATTTPMLAGLAERAEEMARMERKGT